MKTITKLFTLAVVIFGFSATSFGQNFSTVSDVVVGGTIITPITLLKKANMEFGTITAAAGGTVTLNPGGTPDYSGASAYIGSTITNVEPSTAQFTVSGEISNHYSISVTGLPSVVSHSAANGDATMALSDWTSTSGYITFNGSTGLGAGNLDDTGADAFEIGAKLTLTGGAAQLSGRYISAPFSVTVSYE